jgi:hypothetical protein
MDNTHSKPLVGDHEPYADRPAQAHTLTRIQSHFCDYEMHRLACLKTHCILFFRDARTHTHTHAHMLFLDNEMLTQAHPNLSSVSDPCLVTQLLGIFSPQLLSLVQFQPCLGVLHGNRVLSVASCCRWHRSPAEPNSSGQSLRGASFVSFLGQSQAFGA